MRQANTHNRKVYAMITVRLTARDAAGRIVFFTIGMGMSYGSAHAQARTNLRARMVREPRKADTVRRIIPEVI
jgi:hypothetical protein